MKIKSFILALCALAVSIQASAFDLNSLKNLNLGGVINSLISTDKVEPTSQALGWLPVLPLCSRAKTCFRKQAVLLPKPLSKANLPHITNALALTDCNSHSTAPKTS